MKRYLFIILTTACLSPLMSQKITIEYRSIYLIDGNGVRVKYNNSETKYITFQGDSCYISDKSGNIMFSSTNSINDDRSDKFASYVRTQNGIKEYRCYIIRRYTAQVEHSYLLNNGYGDFIPHISYYPETRYRKDWQNEYWKFSSDFSKFYEPLLFSNNTIVYERHILKTQNKLY